MPNIADLQNTKTWTSADGKTRKLKKMHRAHRANLLAKLERDATDYYGSAYDDEALRWLNQQPLVKKLRKLVAADSPPDTLEGDELANLWEDDISDAGFRETLARRIADAGYAVVRIPDTAPANTAPRW